MNDEQKAALRDALAPLQGIDVRTVDPSELKEQLMTAWHVAHRIVRPRDSTPLDGARLDSFERSVMEWEADLLRCMETCREYKARILYQRTTQAMNAQSDALIRLAGVPFGGLEKE